MKENIMKQFTLATIDKVQEMKEAADKAGLHLCVSVDLATVSGTIAIYEMYDDGSLKTPSIFYQPCYNLDKQGCKIFAEQLQEAADLIANYQGKSIAYLEERQADLRLQLDLVKEELRRARRAAK